MLDNKYKLIGKYSEFINEFQKGNIIIDGVEFKHTRQIKHKDLAIIDDFINKSVIFNIRTILYSKKTIRKGNLFCEEEFMIQVPNLELNNLIDVTEFTVVHTNKNYASFFNKREIDYDATPILNNENNEISFYGEFLSLAFDILDGYDFFYSERQL